MIRTCDCKHPFQDDTYGPQMRVKNKCAKGFRCTVCGEVDKVEHKIEKAKGKG